MPACTLGVRFLNLWEPPQALYDGTSTVARYYNANESFRLLLSLVSNATEISGQAPTDLRTMNQMALPESTWLRLKTQLDCLPTLLSGTAEEALGHRQQADKWSARENLAHLARYQEVFLGRLERIRREDHPSLARYRAEDDPEWNSWASRSITDILGSLRTTRGVLTGEIEKLPDEELARTGIHPLLGEMTVVLWLEFFLLHEAHHLLTVLQRSRARPRD